MDPKTPLPLRRSLLNGAVLYYREGLAGRDAAKEAIIKAFANFPDYPEALWPQLAQYAKADLKVENANEILEQMIGHTSDDSIRKQLETRKRIN
jgi:phosphopantetheinyl transferase (holo-ACP synthase)